MSRRVGCDIAASTGVHDGTGLIKMLLAGAKAVQVASAFYRHGTGTAAVMLKELSEWMDRHGFKTIGDFRGSLSQAESINPGVYERVQYMKHYAG
jgi:dihydroorotate dehydrogenase (fumarate)